MTDIYGGDQLATKTIEAPFRQSELEDMYHISNWSNGYFQVGSGGNLEIAIGGQRLALPELIAELRSTGHTVPVVLRFPQIIEDRIERINKVFSQAITESGYGGQYQGVFPIKVNQRRMVVETVAEYGARYRTGLEAGSKAELALILVQDIHEEALIQCNGFKDDDFVRLALWGRKLGKNVIITLEKHAELERVLRVSREMGVRPAIGARFKLHAKGAGQWEASGGDEAKFGLTAAELIDVANRLKAEGLGEALVMLHCHVGSQLTDIRKIRVAVREAAQTYVDLQKLGTGVEYLNVGGGLAVDYDGSKTSFYVSGNYGLQEYADTVVYAVMEACDDSGAPHPTIVTESGRALTAHHAVLVIPVIDAIGPTRNSVELPPFEGEVHSLVRDMRELLADVTLKTYREVYNEAVSNKETMHNLFDLGYLTLLERAHIENLYYRILKRVSRVIESLDYVPEEFETLPRVLADKYVCNFSLFQSLPDNWAIQALFPILPLHRLDERPTRNATLVDITCDSDGKVDRFIDLRDVKSVLPVHELRQGEPYYLGVFLTGAYQDVLGNAHNLFGRVNEAHVRLEEGGWRLERFINGQKARRVIENMGYEAPDLHRWLKETITEAANGHRLTEEEADKLVALYDAELVGYTYLEEVG
ncbi:MAG: biosynthetic arginine decarboxylase [Trueperaceae bacterium]